LANGTAAAKPAERESDPVIDPKALADLLAKLSQTLLKKDKGG
jgi:hypothetical protein